MIFIETAQDWHWISLFHAWLLKIHIHEQIQ
jgi:hypothetical protein